MDSREPSNERSDENLWSPPQVNLKSILIFMVPCAIVFAIVRVQGAEAFFPSIVLLFVLWFFLGCIRLVRPAKKTGRR